MDGSNLQRQSALFESEGARLEPIPKRERLSHVVTRFQEVVGEEAAQRNLRRAERRERRQLELAKKRNPQGSLELRRNKYSRRVMKEEQSNSLVWTSFDEFRMALALLQRSLEQFRGADPGSTTREEIMAWVERKDRHHVEPFSFDICCAAWGLRPGVARENLRHLAQVEALSDAGIHDLAQCLARERWKRIEEVEARFDNPILHGTTVRSVSSRLASLADAVR